MHKHTECEHELKFCSKCDIVYCEICKTEWKHYTMTFSQPYMQYTDGTVNLKDYEVKITCNDIR